MTLAAAFKELSTHLRALHEECIGLRTTIVEDKPLRGDFVLVDVFGDAVDDMLGLLEEALVAVDKEQIDWECMGRALTTSLELSTQLEYRFFDLVSYERLAPFLRFGREQGGEWRAWTNSVKEGLGLCQQPLYDINQALVRCWQEFAERAGMTSVSVQATNIGQQITVPEGRDTTRERIS